MGFPAVKDSSDSKEATPVGDDPDDEAKVNEARELLMAYCARRNDDKTLKSLREMKKTESTVKKSEGSASTAILRKRAQEEAHAAVKRRKAFEDERRLAANEAEAQKEAKAKAVLLTLVAQEKVLKLKLQNRQDFQERKEKEIAEKAHAK